MKRRYSSSSKRRTFRRNKRPYNGYNNRTSVRRSRGYSRTHIHQYTQNASVAMTGTTSTALSTQVLTNQQVPGGSSTYFMCITPALQDISNYIQLIALYDQYKLWKCTLRIRLLNNPDSFATININTTNNKTNYFPSLWIAPDHDDANVLSLAAIKEYGGVKQFMLKGDRYIKYSFRPSVLSQLWNGAITAGYKTERPGSTWIDCANASLPHFGLKMVLDLGGFTASADQFWYFDIQCKYNLAFKNVR